MRVKPLLEDQYQIVAVLNGDECPAEEFLNSGDQSTKAMREGLAEMLATVAERGFDDLPPGWVHEADKPLKVYEFIKGSLRLFFFKGVGRQIAVCVCGGIKKRKKADPKPVKKAGRWRKEYFEAAKSGALETVHEDE
jgi:hypothetical protein